MSEAVQVIEVVGLVLRGLEAVAPTVLRALTGGRSAAEALADARKEAEALSVRTGPDGTWTAQDEAQDARIRGEG